MPPAPDVQAARKLIEEVVDSFEKLEIMLYVHRMGYGTQTPAEIAKATALAIDEVEKGIKALAADGVLEPGGPWTSGVAAVAQMYEEDRIEVLNLMTNSALARVRSQAARVFADAFVIRPKPKKKGDPDA